jgi:hypothetical protein
MTVDASGRAYVDLAAESGGEIRDSVALDEIEEADRVPALGSLSTSTGGSPRSR